tara:strand:+ start:6243 stop:7304 length:1062 start_codon:yes stop_codon:yes gene_type:complete
MKQINIELIREYEANKLVMCQSHPSLPLLIWNYTQTCQFEQAWDDVTLVCRGLITDTDGNIICRGFDKFFNHDEPKGKFASSWKQPFTAYEKLDGSYINIFYYEGQVLVSSRGSFTSDQALWAMEFVNSNLLEFTHFFDKYGGDVTLMCELIHPNNRIVVNYDTTFELVLTGWRLSGQDVDISDIVIGIRKAKTYELDIKKFKDLQKLEELYDGNSEGFVIRFDNGNRVKFKFEDYKRLHHVITGISTKTIWEGLSTVGNIDDLIEICPDEMHNWVNEVRDGLYSSYVSIESLAKSELEDILIINPKISKKDLALTIKGSTFASVIFKMFEDKPYSAMVWSMVKPSYEKAFSI